MRILHIWDQASTASVIAKYQRKLGHETLVIKNAKHDKMKDTSYYGGKIISNKYLFVIKSIITARNYDIIHLHDAWFMVIFLKTLYPKKKIIMHYHGSMVRAELKGKSFRLKNEKFVDHIIVATPDLLEHDYSKQPHYIPNPVDVELFKPLSTTLRNNTGMIVLKKNQSYSKTLKALQKRGFDIKLETISQNEKVEYKLFPTRLVMYEYYVDLPFVNGELIHANSITGLQAMSMGIKTISWDYSVSNSLPNYHHPESVVKEIQRLYDQ